MTYNPWRHLRARADLTLGMTSGLPEGVSARFYADQGVILIDAAADGATRRSALAHELEHAATGDRPYPDGPQGYFTRKREKQCDAAAARKLIPLDVLVDKARWTLDHNELAQELNVDLATLQTRLAHLHPAERAHVKRLLDD